MAGLRSTLWRRAEGIRQLARPVLGSIRSAATTDPVVSLTFDDGPDADITPSVLDTLARHSARATFFVLGDRAAGAPDVLRDVQAAGHEIGLHGLTHRRLHTATTGEIVQVIRDGRHRLEDQIGERVRFFRPPGGAQILRSYVIARAVGLDVVLWSAAARDWTDVPLATMVERATAELGPGGILLLHDAASAPDRRPNGVDRGVLTDEILARVADRGWRSVTVRELLTGRRARRDVDLKARRRQARVPTNS